MNDLATVLKAIAQVETGGNSYPRFERSFAPAGQSFTVQGHIITGTGTNFTSVAAKRWAVYGMASACSFGPWQILYHTAADHGFAGQPSDLWFGSQPIVESRMTALFHKGANTIAKLADAWNSGSFTDANVPGDYIAKVVQAFINAGGDPVKPLDL